MRRVLVLRSLAWFWREHLPLSFAVAIAAAVVCAALLVGSSVQATLRERFVQPLGDLRWAWVSQGTLTERTATSSGAGGLVHARAALRSSDGIRALGSADVWGVDESSSRILGVSQLGPGEAAITPELGERLGVNLGDDLVLVLPQIRDAGPDTLFGSRDPAEASMLVVATVVAWLDPERAGLFMLHPQSRMPRNVFVERHWLAEQLGRQGTVHALVSEQPLDRSLLSAEDFGYRWSPHGDGLLHDRIRIDSAVAERMRDQGLMTSGSYLATTVETADGRRAHYAVMASRSDLRLGPEEVMLGSWLAEELAVGVGDELSLTALIPRPDGGYDEVVNRVRVVAVDAEPPRPWLTPEVEGITEAARMDQWNPTFPVQLERVTERDELYWDRYRAAPKLWVGQGLVDKLWGQEGVVTAVEVPAGRRAEVEAGLTASLRRDQVLVRDVDLLAQAESAARGSSDFRGLFLGLGAVVVLASLSWAGSLVRLSVERRAAQTGLLSALGAEHRVVRRWLLEELGAVCTLGAAVGSLLGVALTTGLLALLDGGWSSAVAGFRVEFFLDWGWVAATWAAMSAIAFLAVWVAMRPGRSRAQGRRRPLWAVSMALAVLSLFLPDTLRHVALALALVLLGEWLYQWVSWRSGPMTAFTLANRFSANSGAGMVTFRLMVLASALLIVVAVNRRDFAAMDPLEQRSGTGGYSLWMETIVPLPVDLGSPEGRRKLGFEPQDEQLLAGVRFDSFLVGPGEPASCLNVAMPTSPKLLGMSERFLSRGGFVTRGFEWTDLMDAEPTPGVLDAETAQWILRLSPGDTFLSTAGLPVRVQGLVGMSILADYAMVSHDAFLRHHPAHRSPSLFLIEAPLERRDAIASRMQTVLGPAFGVETRSTTDVLNDLAGVQNGYLAAFLGFGVCALLIATLGMASSIIRLGMSRRAHLALLSAMGVPVRTIRRALMLEQLPAVMLGVAWGVLCGAVTTWGPLTSGLASPDWEGAAGALILTVLFAVASAWLGVAATLRGNLIERLRSE